MWVWLVVGGLLCSHLLLLGGRFLFSGGVCIGLMPFPMFLTEVLSDFCVFW